MTGFWIGVAVGLFAGGGIGIVAMAIVAAGALADLHDDDCVVIDLTEKTR